MMKQAEDDRTNAGESSPLERAHQPIIPSGEDKERLLLFTGPARKGIKQSRIKKVALTVPLYYLL